MTVTTDRAAEDARRDALARVVLRRVHELSRGDTASEVAWSEAVEGSVESYLESRRTLGLLLENGWIVRIGRDLVTITDAGVVASVR